MTIIKEMQKRPGGPLKGKPIVGLDGKTWYDPFGEEIVFDPKDVIYAEKFWSKGKPAGLKEVMIQNIRDAVQYGFLRSFVDPSGIMRDDREKLSAYRVLAQQMGYEVGKFSFNQKSFVAAASLRKSEYLV